MAAFRPDDNDERDLRMESYALDVTPDAFYPEWELDALTDASLLIDGLASFEESEGGRPGAAVPAPSEIDLFVAAGERLLETMGRFLEEDAA